MEAADEAEKRRSGIRAGSFTVISCAHSQPTRYLAVAPHKIVAGRHTVGAAAYRVMSLAFSGSVCERRTRKSADHIASTVSLPAGIAGKFSLVRAHVMSAPPPVVSTTAAPARPGTGTAARCTPGFRKASPMFVRAVRSHAWQVTQIQVLLPASSRRKCRRLFAVSIKPMEWAEDTKQCRNGCNICVTCACFR